ncbi:MAG: acylneuraminate cytidylyltransferase family protein [Oscillospiraceae bacterium]
MKNVLITICGRAGSKGFKNKNLKTFLDRPLVYYTLSSAFDFKQRVENASVDICLNTDSDILQKLVSERYPEVFFIKRPEELSGDVVPKMAVFQQSLSYMEDSQGKSYDYLIDLDITSPLRQIDDVLGAYEMKLKRLDAGLVFSACGSRRNPYFNMVKRCGDHVEKVIESPYTARQQAPEIYDLNASIYVFETSFLKNDTTGILWQTKCLAYLMRDTAVLDIDSEEDFEMMQLIGGYLFKNVEGFKAVRDNIRG